MARAKHYPKHRQGNALATIGGLTREASRIYQRMKKGKIDHEMGRSLVWVLAQLRAMVEAQLLEDIEKKLTSMAGGQVEILRSGDAGDVVEHAPLLLNGKP